MPPMTTNSRSARYARRRWRASINECKDGTVQRGPTRCTDDDARGGTIDAEAAEFTVATRYATDDCNAMQYEAERECDEATMV